MADKTVKKVITPNEKSLLDIFRNDKSYFIDIYQREYKWDKENVKTLLQDIEVRFQLNQRTKSSPKDIERDVVSNFEPYFLNSFLTHKTEDGTYIVDGQQRLTTFLLVLIKMFRIVKDIRENGVTETYDPGYISELIYEKDPFGAPGKFKIYNSNREEAFNATLNENKAYIAQDETQSKILANYELINDWYEKFFKSDTDYDIVKINYYIAYLLNKLAIIEVEITKSNDVPMIFEVVNDRGLGLKPYEILKGKLIGVLENSQKENASNVWADIQNNYFNNNLSLDEFFKTFLRAKFANSEADYKKFEDKYHYEIYRNPEILEYFGYFKDQDILHKVVTEDIYYYSDLYLRLNTSNEYEYVVYNRLLDQNQQYLLILSSINYNNNENDLHKIEAISKKFDQFHTILRLLDVYDSNSFQDLIYVLNKYIRNKDISEINSIFDTIFIKVVENKQLIEEGKYATIEDVFEFDRFKNISNNGLNFSKYILMRTDLILSDWLKGKPSYVKDAFNDLESIFNKTNRRIYGLQLEHILARNEENNRLFLDENGIFDEASFNKTRNLLGAVLLLKDRHNSSSGNDIYKDKMDIYSKSDIIWNQILVGHLNEVDLKTIPETFYFEVQEPDENGLLPLEAIEKRQKELFSIIKYIWCDSM